MIHKIRHLDCVLIKWHTLDGDTSHVLASWQQTVVSIASASMKQFSTSSKEGLQRMAFFQESGDFVSITMPMLTIGPSRWLTFIPFHCHSKSRGDL